MDYITEQLRPLAVPIDDVHPDPANARTGHAVGRIAASLRTYGQRTPIVANRSQGGKIEKGNGTWAAAKSLGWGMIAAVLPLFSILRSALVTAKKSTGLALLDVFLRSPYLYPTARTRNRTAISLALMVAIGRAVNVFCLPSEFRATLLTHFGQSPPRLSVTMLRPTRFTPLGFITRGFNPAINAVGVFWLTLISMLLSVTVHTKRTAVINIVSQLRVINPGLNVIGFQVSPAQSAILAGVAIPLKYGRAPRLVLIPTLLYLTTRLVSFVAWVIRAPLEMFRVKPVRVFGAFFNAVHNALPGFRPLPCLFDALAYFLSLSRAFVKALFTAIFTAALYLVRPRLKGLFTVFTNNIYHSVIIPQCCYGVT